MMLTLTLTLTLTTPTNLQHLLPSLNISKMPHHPLVLRSQPSYQKHSIAKSYQESAILTQPMHKSTLKAVFFDKLKLRLQCWVDVLCDGMCTRCIVVHIWGFCHCICLTVDYLAGQQQDQQKLACNLFARQSPTSRIHRQTWLPGRIKSGNPDCCHIYN